MTDPASLHGDAMSKTYTIPLVWEEYGKVTVEAESLEKAIAYALGPDCPLPEGNYIDDSVQVDIDLINEMEGNCNA